MFDDRIVDAPNEFRVGRPDYIYTHFGYGLHTCAGQYINRFWNSFGTAESFELS